MNPSLRRRSGGWRPSARLHHDRVDRRACGSWWKGFQNLLSWRRRPADVSGLRAIGIDCELPQRRFAGVRMDFDETEALVQIPNHGIFRSRDVFAAQYVGAAFARRFNGDIHNLELEFPAKHTAAHHPRVDVENTGLRAGRPHDHRTDQAVVPESIDETELEHDVGAILAELRDLFQRMTLSGRIELIGLVDELRDPRYIDVLDGAIDSGHVQAGEVVVKIMRRAPVGFTNQIFGISLRALAVVRREGGGLEVSRLCDAFDISGHVVRQFRDGDHGQRLAHCGTFRRVVVDEHQAVDSEFELRGDHAKVFGLWLPIGGKSGKILAAQNHFGVFVDRAARDIGVVLRAHREYDTALRQILGVALQREMRLASGRAFAEDDALNAVIADDAAPQGVVEIEDEAFLR